MSSRKLTDAEFALIQRIISVRRNEAERLQVGVDVTELDREGSIKFVQDRGLKEIEQRKFPVEAQAQDEDGMWIHALLFLADNRIDELEIYKDDGSMIRKMPGLEQWQILDLDQ